MITTHANMVMLKSPIKKHARSQKGNALVEFAFILPLFLFLVLGMITFSLALYDKTILTMATREGARAGAIASPGNQINDAQNAGNSACSGKLISFGTGSPDFSQTTMSGSNIIVKATYTYTGITFLPEFVLPNTLDLTTETTMRVETP
jgi:Flp pilus assembly protein TadG